MSMGEDRTGTDEGRGVLIAEYVLGLLDPATHARVERQVEADPALRAERDFWVARFGALDGDFAEVTPPAHVLDRIERRLFAEPVKAGWWDSLALWRGLAGAAAAVALLAIGFNLMTPRFDAGQMAVQLVAALQAQEGSGVEFVAVYDEARGQVRITSLRGEAVPDRDFELWYINGEQPPVSMGIIPVDQRLEIPLDAATRADIGPGTVLAVTLEQAGGSPTGAPQGPVVAAGAATAI